MDNGRQSDDTSIIQFHESESSETKREDIMLDGISHEVRRIVLIGKTGSGKSSTGNTILGISDAFFSKLSGKSITKYCQMREAERFGKKLLVVDTPGMFDTNNSNECTNNEIGKLMSIIAPGPHAIILVVQIDRITEEEQKTVDLFADRFGEEMYRYLIVLFTRKDDLVKTNTPIELYANETEELTVILKKCQGRYIAFDNFSPDKDKDVQLLIGMIENIVQQNGGKCYTSDMFIEAENAAKRRMAAVTEEERKKKDEEIKSYKEEIAKPFEDEIKTKKDRTEKIQKEMEEIKNLQQKEREKQRQLSEEKTQLQNEKAKMEQTNQSIAQNHQREIQRLRQKESDQKKTLDKQLRLEKEQKQLQTAKEAIEKKGQIEERNRKAEIERLRQKEVDHQRGALDKQRQLEEKRKQLQKAKEDIEKKRQIDERKRKAEIERLRQKEADHKKALDKQRQLEEEIKQLQKR